eukprot:CAMPEP_0174745082 /NCGR_PEP_ID=MMETSP1094-20130205/86023_1 /TAXON_ID=156173 /ORGANISM="Chrysochromulina brevifilum, Strain UTEX LB 985" /LENGTH=106 /DNA_ID=CAMNT_0015949585 /DNA_START=165 /DNA_END=485 /DNA_ORIENTATION=-
MPRSTPDCTRTGDMESYSSTGSAPFGAFATLRQKRRGIVTGVSRPMTVSTSVTVAPSVSPSSSLSSSSSAPDASITGPCIPLKGPSITSTTSSTENSASSAAASAS